jgi:hypothetical protein
MLACSNVIGCSLPTRNSAVTCLQTYHGAATGLMYQSCCFVLAPSIPSWLRRVATGGDCSNHQQYELQG